jgi:hypothetical protein
MISVKLPPSDLVQAFYDFRSLTVDIVAVLKW